MRKSVQTLPDPDFYRAFAGRVREHLGADHDRSADLTDIPGRTVAPAATTTGHFPWCDRHHTDVCDDGTRLTDHEGARIHLPVPQGMCPRDGEVLSAALFFSENAVDERVLLSIGSGGEGTLLDAAEADAAIESLAAFLEQLRALRGQMAAGR